MTTAPLPGFRLTAETGPGTVRLRLAGELDFDTADELAEEAARHLSRSGLRRLHLDFGELTLCDSMGLSVLLLIHRQAAARGAVLHLDDRPAFLDRLMATTGTLAHLTAPGAAETAQTRRTDGIQRGGQD